MPAAHDMGMGQRGRAGMTPSSPTSGMLAACDLCDRTHSPGSRLLLLLSTQACPGAGTAGERGKRGGVGKGWEVGVGWSDRGKLGGVYMGQIQAF